MLMILVSVILNLAIFSKRPRANELFGINKHLTHLNHVSQVPISVQAIVNNKQEFLPEYNTWSQ